MTDQFEILLQKLDVFIRRYYKNQLIKGAIYCLSLLVIFFLLVIFLEYYGNFDITTRTIIFYSYLVINLFIIGKYIVIPVSHLLKFGKIISHKQAAQIIGNHFSEVNDKLLNTLQLRELFQADSQSIDLINASIDQKINEIKPIPFGHAIDLKKNRRYLKFAIPPLLVLIILLFSAPTIITEPANRLVKHTEHFDKPLSFNLEILNDELEVVQYEDYNLKIKVLGDEVPENVYVEVGNNLIKLLKEDIVSFHYTFQNIQSDLKFNLIADDFKSNDYTLKVLPKPVILDFEIFLDYPAYTGKKDETTTKNGDLIVPLGSKIAWKFYTKNTEKISLGFLKERFDLEQNGSNIFTYKDMFVSSQPYTVISSNNFLVSSDSLSYNINVIPDLYPTILVEEMYDSTAQTRLFFKGVIKDDYGFAKLNFNYIIESEEDNNLLEEKEKLLTTTTNNPQQFYHSFDLANLNLNAGDRISYFFEVWDNDAINGSKSSRTQVMTFKLPTKEEVKEMTEKSNESIKDLMKEALDEVEQLKKEVDELNKKLFEKKELNWEDKKQLEALLEQQKNLQEKIESLKNENIEKNNRDQQYNELDEEIIQKQKQLEELFNELMKNEELNKLFEELQELLDEVDKDKVSDMLEKMKMSTEELDKMLDRNLELFKQLEFEQKLDETIDKLEELAEKQEKLGDETLDKKADEESIKKEQEELNKEFEELKDDLEKLDDLNKELEDPNKFDKMEEEQEEISEDMENSLDSMEENKKKEASKSQKGASQKMEQMAASLSSMQEEMIEEGMAEDIDALRDILENLIELSFNQEELIGKVSNVNLNDPNYTNLAQEQKKIKDDLAMVEDSLVALSKRQIMIEPFITKEISSIDNHIDKSIGALNNRRTGQAASNQQYVMTSINNLALMLSETLNQMMMSMMQQGSCNSSCKSGQPKPGAGKGSMKSMRQLQDQLNKQIEGLKKGMEKGDKDGSMPGNKSGQSMSEQLARMAAEQEALRKRLNEYSEQLDKEGNFGASKELKQIMQDMEKTETDLVNKILSQETLMRQKEIMTRLLESEKAELEREKEEKRESKEANIENYRNPEEIFKYNRQLSNEVELLKSVPPSLKPFYKLKVNQYFYNFEELLKQ